MDGFQVPGPRLSPKYLGKNIQEGEDNVLAEEDRKSREIYEKIMSLQKEGFIKKGHEIDFIDVAKMHREL